MARVTSKMGLRVWDQLGDAYDHTQQANNWARVDYHDHTPGRGVQIPTNGIEDGAVTPDKLAGEVVVASFIPVGIVFPYAGPSPLQQPTAQAPEGYVFADGSTYDGTLSAYANLWSLIGTTYGGTGISAFAVPNLCKTTAGGSTGRVPFGVHTIAALGASGGVTQVTLTGAQSGTNGNGQTDPGGADGQFQGRREDVAGTGGPVTAPTFNLYSDGLNAVFWEVDNPDHSHSLVSRDADSPHDNMPPYQAVNYIIKL